LRKVNALFLVEAIPEELKRKFHIPHSGMEVVAAAKIVVFNFVEEPTISFLLMPQAKHHFEKDTRYIYELRKYFCVIFVKRIEVGNSVKLLIVLGLVKFSKIAYLVNYVSLDILQLSQSPKTTLFL
jgi:hypothetical protein